MEVELRCQVGTLHGDPDAGNLLAKLQLSHPPPVTDLANLVELACPYCRTALRKAGRPAARVLHRYDFSGELVETLVVAPGDGDRASR
jgi:hypothetical protein